MKDNEPTEYKLDDYDIEQLVKFFELLAKIESDMGKPAHKHKHN